MPGGNYLWRMNDHARTQREIRRHSRIDAEAYDEFSKMMTPMCRFVKPILSMVPPDPTTLHPRDLQRPPRCTRAISNASTFSASVFASFPPTSATPSSNS